MKHPGILGTSGSLQIRMIGLVSWKTMVPEVIVSDETVDRSSLRAMTFFDQLHPLGQDQKIGISLKNNPQQSHISQIPVTSVLARLKCEAATHFLVQKSNCFYKSLPSHWLTSPRSLRRPLDASLQAACRAQ